MPQRSAGVRGANRPACGRLPLQQRHALNDYYIDIPLSDVEHYNIILAYKMDGEMLKIRNFGPLFLVYPRDDSGPELNSPLYNSRFIWQVNRIVIK